MLVVIDTNVMLAAVPRRSLYHWLFAAYLERKFELAFSNEMLTEYEEQFFIHWHPVMAEDICAILLEAYNTILVDVYYQFNLIKDDPDDNKFADCAIASGAKYFVTFDKHFNLLKKLDFPKVIVVHPDEFKQILLDANLIKP